MSLISMMELREKVDSLDFDSEKWEAKMTSDLERLEKLKEKYNGNEM